MTRAEKTFTLIAMTICGGLFLGLLATGSLRMPRDLKDPVWGRLDQFEEALHPISRGMSKRDVFMILGDKTFAVTNASDITCLWQSQPHGFFNEPTQRRYTYEFDETGHLTNIVMIDNEHEIVNGHRQFRLVLF